MSNNNDTNVFVVRESLKTYGVAGPKRDAVGDQKQVFGKWETFKADDEESRFTTMSPNGTLLAVGNSSLVNIFSTADGSLKSTIRHRLLSAKFSPGDGYLIGWDNPNKNVDNFNIWSLNGSKHPTLVHSQKQSKQLHVEFSADESVYATLSNKCVHFHNVSNFHNIVHKTPETMKVANFSLSPQQPNQSSENSGQFYVLLFIPAASGGPSFARLYRYPNFENQIISKSFFQADSTEMKWNKKGTAVLLITTTDIDRTGESYYGKTMVHYLDIKGTSATVQTESDSNVIHAVQWSPGSTEFCVITGKMPQTRAVLLNSKVEKILDMGITARNTIHFNPQGNILLLCAFGNLQGNIEVWEINQHKKLLISFRAPDTTQLVWLNDGVHFVTATTAPRMQVGNCFKVWNIAGSCIYEWKADKHLFGVIPFISNPSLPFGDEGDKLVEKLIKNPSASVKASSGGNATPKANVYVPVHKRKGVIGAAMPASANPGGLKLAAGESSLSEKDKKIRTLKKKLEQIEKMKEQVNQGKQLEKNQLEKLSKEKELIDELAQLEIS